MQQTPQDYTDLNNYWVSIGTVILNAEVVFAAFSIFVQTGHKTSPASLTLCNRVKDGKENGLQQIVSIKIVGREYHGMYCVSQIHICPFNFSQ